MKSTGTNEGAENKNVTAKSVNILICFKVILIAIMGRVGSLVDSTPFDRRVAGSNLGQATSIAPLEVRYYSEALPTQHGWCEESITFFTYSYCVGG